VEWGRAAFATPGKLGGAAFEAQAKAFEAQAKEARPYMLKGLEGGVCRRLGR
jgi:hypothetical protein